MKVTMCYPEGRKKAVTLSYDDGVAQDIRLMKIMNQYGLKGTFNLNSGNVPDEDAVDGKGKLSKRQILELYPNSGHEVAAHGYHHPTLNGLPAANITADVLLDRMGLENMFGTMVRGMAYPNGSYSDEVVACLKACGIVYARTVISTENFELPQDWLRLPATCHHNNPRLFELTEQFVTTQRRLVDRCWMFYLWGHSYEFDTHNNWERIEEFAKRIGGHEDIWYATNIEIYEYIDAYRQIRYNVEGTLAYNPTQIDVWVVVNRDCLINIKAGETVQLPTFVE